MELKSGDLFFYKFLWKVKKKRRRDQRRKSGEDKIAKRSKC